MNWRSVFQQKFEWTWGTAWQDDFKIASIRGHCVTNPVCFNYFQSSIPAVMQKSLCKPFPSWISRLSNLRTSYHTGIFMQPLAPLVLLSPQIYTNAVPTPHHIAGALSVELSLYGSKFISWRMGVAHPSCADGTRMLGPVLHSERKLCWLQSCTWCPWLDLAAVWYSIYRRRWKDLHIWRKGQSLASP